MPFISKIIIYPFKSLPGIEVSAARFTAAGSLAGDREFAFESPDGRVVNAKRLAEIHKIRAEYNLPKRTITLWSEATPRKETFTFDHQREALSAWVAKQLDIPGLRLKQNSVIGFPDDIKSPGPTIVSEATLTAAGQYFDPPIDLPEITRRMRPNIIIKGVEPYWEDALYGQEGVGGLLTLGQTELIVTGPCQRCVVPTRDSQTGDPTPQFMKRFMEIRRATLPGAQQKDPRFEKNPYRLCVNVLGPVGGAIQVSDTLKIEGEVELGAFQGKTSTALTTGMVP